MGEARHSSYNSIHDVALNVIILASSMKLKFDPLSLLSQQVVTSNNRVVDNQFAIMKPIDQQQR